MIFDNVFKKLETDLKQKEEELKKLERAKRFNIPTAALEEEKYQYQ